MHLSSKVYIIYLLTVSFFSQLFTLILFIFPVSFCLKPSFHPLRFSIISQVALFFFSPWALPNRSLKLFICLTLLQLHTIPYQSFFYNVFFHIFFYSHALFDLFVGHFFIQKQRTELFDRCSSECLVAFISTLFQSSRCLNTFGVTRFRFRDNNFQPVLRIFVLVQFTHHMGHIFFVFCQYHPQISICKYQLQISVTNISLKYQCLCVHFGKIFHNGFRTYYILNSVCDVEQPCKILFDVLQLTMILSFS